MTETELLTAAQVTTSVGAYTATCPLADCRPSLAVMRYVAPTVASIGTVNATVKSPAVSALAWTSGRPSSQLIVTSAADHPCPLTFIALPGEAFPPISAGPAGVGDGVGGGVGVGCGVGVGSGVGAGVEGRGGVGVRTGGVVGGSVGAWVGSVAVTAVGVGDGVGLAVAFGGDAWPTGGGVTSIPAAKPKRGSGANSDAFGAPFVVARGDDGGTTTRVGARSTSVNLARPFAVKAPVDPRSTARLEPNFVPGGPPPLTE